MNKNLRNIILTTLLASNIATPIWASEITHPYHPYVDTQYVDYNGKHFAEINFFTKDFDPDSFGIIGDIFNKGLHKGDFPEDTLKSLNYVVSYCTQMLGPGSKNTETGSLWRFVVTDYDYNTAACETHNCEIINKEYKPDGIEYWGSNNPNNMLVHIIRDGDSSGKLFWDKNYNEFGTDVGTLAFTGVYIGKYLSANNKNSNYGWSYHDEYTRFLPTETPANLTAVLIHEMGHALGMVTKMEIDKFTGFNSFASDYDGEQNFAMHLINKDGIKAEPGMLIITEEDFKKYNTEHPDAKLDRKKVFILDNTFGTPEQNVWFVGDHTEEVLGEAKFGEQEGIPVDAYNYFGNKNIDLCHLKFNGIMSSRYYANTATFTEAELAIFQDLGYKLDRKNYYGKSIYNDGLTYTNTQGYSARNAEGTAYVDGRANETALGVGLHVYGSKNTITQAGDILTKGFGAAGILVNGLENNIILAKDTQVRADGANAYGVLFSYGRDHNFTQNGVVTSLGTDGNAVVFDMGNNSGGLCNEYHGSYIRYFKYLDLEEANSTYGKVIMGNNEYLTEDFSATSDQFFNYANDELKGALVNSYDVNGTLKGGKNAIYIGKNAFVKDININEGSQIVGNITSDWKDFREVNGNSYDEEVGPIEGYNIYGLKIQYNGHMGNDGYAYTDYIPNLVTNLNFNANMNYAGEIKGYNNIKMNVKENTLNFTGTADVVSVNIAEGASLFGGTYNLQKQEVAELDKPSATAINSSIPNTETVVSKLLYSDTGVFVNNGMLGAFDKDLVISAVNASGEKYAAKLSGSGKISVNNDNVIKVNGTADLSKMSFTGTNVKLGEGERLEVIEANSIIDPNNTSGDYSSLTNYSFIKDGSTANGLNSVEKGYLTFEIANNAGLSVEEFVLVEKEDALRKANKLSAKETALFDNFTGQNNSDLHKSIAQLQNGIALDLAQDAMRNKAVHSAVSGRVLDSVSHSADSNKWWANMGKSRDTFGHAKAHGSIISTGYDFYATEDAYAGAMFSYNDRSVSNDGANGKYKEYAGALYGAKQNGAGTLSAYASYGHQNNEVKRTVATSSFNAACTAHFGSNTLGLGASYAFDLEHGKDARWHVAPYISIDYAHYKQNAYSESGSIFGLGLDGYHADYADTSMGVNFKQRTADATYILGAAYKRTLTDNRDSANLMARGSLTPWSIANQEEGRNRFVLSAYADKHIGGKWNAVGYVEQGWARGSRSTSMNVELKYSF